MILLRHIGSKLMRFPRSRLFSSSHDISKAIDELNQEMESVFGHPSASGPSSSSNTHTISQDSHHPLTDDPPKNKPFIAKLSHISTKGEAQMVDVSSKEITNRVAIASCRVILGREVFDLVSANQMEKGDVLGIAKIAGVCGAKETSSLIPLCHNVNLSHIHLDLKLNPCDLSVDIEGRAVSDGKTGVEMEALTAVTVAGLTVYDMCKAGSKGIVIMDVRLEHKSGGKSGVWSRKV